MAPFKVTILTAILMPVFNVLAYCALRQGISPRWIALCLVSLLTLRFGKLIAQKVPIMMIIGGLAAAGVMAWTCSMISLLYYPAVVNAVFLSCFALSLWFPPTVVERIARLQYPDLDAKGILYTRRVTQVWCAFLLCNGCIALSTAISGNTAVWAFYNGFLSYVLMGILFACEWLVRRRVLSGHT